MEPNFRTNDTTIYFALGTKQKASREAKTIIDAPYRVYAVNVIRNGNWFPDYATARIVGTKGLDILIDPEFSNTCERRKVNKWLTERMLLHNAPDSRPKSLLTKEQVLELLAERCVETRAERTA